MKILKAVIKFILIAIVAIIGGKIAYFGWMFIDNKRSDEPLAPGFTEFFAEPTPLPYTQNGFFAFMGINAPPDSDTMAFGKQILDLELARENPEEESEAEKQLYNTRISFKGDIKSLECWISQNGRMDAQKQTQPCASAEEIRSMAADNKLLLDRITALGNYENFMQPNILGGWLNGQLLIEGQKLISAKMALDASEGKAEQALATWLADAKMLQHMQSGQLSLMMRALVSAVQNIHTRTMPIIIAAMTPEQVALHSADIYAILDAPAFGKNGWDVAATMRTELRVFKGLEKTLEMPEYKPKSTILKHPYKPNVTRNRFYSWAKELVELSKVEPIEFLSKYQEVNPEHFKKGLWNIILINPGNITGELVLRRMFIGKELLLNAHREAAYRRMLKLYVAAKSQGTSAADMPKTISSLGVEYNNPLTGQAFGWDAEHQSIYFEMPNQPSPDRIEVFY